MSFKAPDHTATKFYLCDAIKRTEAAIKFLESKGGFREEAALGAIELAKKQLELCERRLRRNLEDRAKALTMASTTKNAFLTAATNEPRAQVGDYVRLPEGLRRVERIVARVIPGDHSFYLSDGGVCGTRDILEVLLPSEVE